MHPIESEELMAYLDGELMPPRASEAAQHLSHCRECQSAAAEMQCVSRRLLEWQIEESGPRIEQAINSERPLKRSRPIWRRGGPCAGDMGSDAAAKGHQYCKAHVDGRQNDAGGARRLWHPPESYVQPASADEPLIPARNRDQGPGAASRSPRHPHRADHSDHYQLRSGARLARRDPQASWRSHRSPADSGQTLQATLRVPANRLDTAMVEIRHLGRVENEQQGGEEVTGQTIDLDSRLANTRNTEQRLAGILRGSTGKISDVLAVEKEIDRVRGDIERMEAERKNLGDRVNFATLEVRINEEYKAHLAVSAPSTPGRLRNSAVEGYRNVADSLTGIAMLVLAYGPALVLWAALLFFPARFAWRRLRKRG